MRKRVDASSEISLLYLPGKDKVSGGSRWGEYAVEDLEIERLAWALSIQNEYQEAIKCVLLELCQDTDTLLYRQEILEDFLNRPALADRLEGLLSKLAKLGDYASSRYERTPLRETLARLSELNLYVDCIRTLKTTLEDPQMVTNSRGMETLRRWAEQTVADEEFQSLEKELPGLLAKLNGIPSISIGVNLDGQLRPVEATLLAIHEKPFKGGGSFLDKVTGRRSGKKPNQGIGPLHEVSHQYMDAPGGRLIPLPTRADPLLVPLFRDLYEMLRWLVAPINDVLQQFAQVDISYLISLETEIAFYIGAAKFVTQMKSLGMPMCRPQILAAGTRSGQLERMYNLFLAMHKAEETPATVLTDKIVLNNVNFGPEGRIFVLTGPNLGGKTVYTQAVGVIQVLFQAGLSVPAISASISPVDSIYTHFARLERSDSGMGRLGDEAQRLNVIFQSISEKSLVLLNESLASTSPGESLYLARDIVRALRLYGARAIFATHLHELADSVDTINAEVQGDSRVISLVAGIGEPNRDARGEEDIVPRTYHIQPGPPLGLSYARGIASRYGISFEQLSSKWKEKMESKIPEA